MHATRCFAARPSSLRKTRATAWFRDARYHVLYGVVRAGMASEAAKAMCALASDTDDFVYLCPSEVRKDAWCPLSLRGESKSRPSPRPSPLQLTVVVARPVFLADPRRA